MNSLIKNSTAASKSERLGYLFGLALISSAAFSIFSPPANAHEGGYMMYGPDGSRSFCTTYSSGSTFCS